MRSYAERLRERIAKFKTPLCVGIDPDFGALAKNFADGIQVGGAVSFIGEFSRRLIKAATGQCSSVKFQMAFFEEWGSHGIALLETLIKEAKAAGLLVILDAKRGDIANTMQAYTNAAFKNFEADALTITPYMGVTVLDPCANWLKAGRAVYVVWVTSNPDGAELQELVVTNAKTSTKWTFAEELLDQIATWQKKHDNLDIGLVLGATKVGQLPAALLGRLENYDLLMPGFGAQGAMLVPQTGKLLKDARTALLPVSRQLYQAPHGAKFEDWNEFEKHASSVMKQLNSQFAAGL